MVDDLYDTYASKLNDMCVWEADFLDMAQLLMDDGNLFPNCIGFLGISSASVNLWVLWPCTSLSLLSAFTMGTRRRLA